MTTSKKVQPAIDFDPDGSWRLVDTVLEHARRVLLWGPPGTGKTYAAQRTPGAPVYVWNLTDETPSAEGRGFYVPQGDRFAWQDGPALRAWREGARLVLNEIHRASNDTLSFLLPLLDDAPSARMSLPNGETIAPHSCFTVIATANDPPEALPEALRDRFPIAIEIKTPHPDAIAALPAKLQRPAWDTATAEDVNQRLSIRAWYAFADLASKVSTEDAARAVFGARAADVMTALKLASA